MMSNLKLVYGENFPKESAYMLKQIYCNFTYLWFEVLQVGKLFNENKEQFFSVYNRELIEQALKDGNGVILLSGHLGNFEWLAALFGFYGWPFAAIAKKQKNPYVDKFIRERRESNGARVIYVKSAMKDGLRLLKNKGILGIVGDQDARRKGIFINFLGQPSSTAIGPAIFHLRSKAPMFWVSAIRTKYAQFEIHFEKIETEVPFEINDENIKNVTQKHSDVLEKWVRKYPEQWFWMHRRWKTKLKK